MRINTKVVSDIETGKILSRESFEYNGSVESCDPATIIALIGLGIGGASTGYQLANQPSAPTPPTTPPGPAPPTPAQQAQTTLQQKAAVGQQLPTDEGLTSGFLSPAAYAQEGALQAGVAGQPGGQGAALQAALEAFGLPPGILTGGTASATPKKFTPAGAGGTNQGAFPTGPKDLSDFVSTFFKG